MPRLNRKPRKPKTPPRRPPELILVRGLPGTGKSTIAARLAKRHGYRHLEDDQFFIDRRGDWIYDPAKKNQARRHTLDQTRRHLAAGRRVVVANHFLRAKDMMPYVRLGHPTAIIEAAGNYISPHAWPKASVTAMRKYWEDLPPRLAVLAVTETLEPAPSRNALADQLAMPAAPAELTQAILFDPVAPADSLQTNYLPEHRALRRRARSRMLKVAAQDQLRRLIQTPPAKGESIHIVTSGQLEFFNFLPVLIDMIGGRADEFWASTWTMNRDNVDALEKMATAGQLGQINILTGLYFKSRETAVYHRLVQATRRCGGHYRAARNHAKIMALANHRRRRYYVTEGSANFTANPRIEQYVLTNDKALFDFHRQWQSEILEH